MGVAVCDPQQHLIHVDLQQGSISPACLVSSPAAPAFSQRHTQPQASGRHNSLPGTIETPCGHAWVRTLMRLLSPQTWGLVSKCFLRSRSRNSNTRNNWRSACMTSINLHGACSAVRWPPTVQAGLLLIVANTCEERHTSQH